MGFFEDDICWCYNSQEKDEFGCDKVECFRHMSNRKPQSQPDIFTVAYLKGTQDCPFEKELR